MMLKEMIALAHFCDIDFLLPAQCFNLIVQF